MNIKHHQTPRLFSQGFMLNLNLKPQTDDNGRYDAGTCVNSVLRLRRMREVRSELHM